MLIHQITESNYEQERKIGETELKAKFYKYDSLINIPDSKWQIANALKDPTVWAYATLKDPNTNNPLKLYPYQDKFINDKNRFVYVTAANQIGKTFAICIKALHHALHVPNASVIIVSKSEQQAVKVLDEIKWMMRKSHINYEERIGDIENRTELHLNGPNESIGVIRCFPPTNTVLGFPATLLIGDEINYWEKAGELSPVEYYDQVLEPRTNMTKSWKHPFLTMGQIIFISNPNGKQGIGWRTYSEDSRFNNYVYCSLAYPLNTLEEYNGCKKRLSPHRFSSIYAAEYVSADGGFITIDQYNEFAKSNISLSIPMGSVLYLGGDFSGEDVKSKDRDANLLYGVVQIPLNDQYNRCKLRVVYRKSWPSGTKKQTIYDEIKRLGNLPEVSIARFDYDKVGVGDKVKNDLIDQQILNEYQIESLTYSLQNKSDVFIHMQGLFEQHMIEGRDIDELRNQLMSLEVKQLEGSPHLKIHHRTETIHDDECDSLANACWAARRINSVPVSVKVLNTNPMDKILDCRHLRMKHTPEGELECLGCGDLV